MDDVTRELKQFCLQLAKGSRVYEVDNTQAYQPHSRDKTAFEVLTDAKKYYKWLKE